MHDDKEYRTTDTPLAAYLMSQGFDILIIEYDDGGRATYIFSNDSTQLKEHIKLFKLGKAESNITAYERARNALLVKIHRGLP